MYLNVTEDVLKTKQNNNSRRLKDCCYHTTEQIALLYFFELSYRLKFLIIKTIAGG